MITIALVPQDENNIVALESEINLMRSLNHPHIVRYLGTEVQLDEESSQRVLYIFTEWVPGGSLESLLKHFGGLAESVVASYTRQILTGQSLYDIWFLISLCTFELNTG